MLPALKTTVRGLGGKTKSKSKHRAAVREAMQRVRLNTCAQILKKTAKTGLQVRQAAHNLGRGIDTSLQYCGSGLARFKRLGHFAILQPTEKRYLKPCKRPFPFEVPDGIPQRRSCVWDREAKKQRYDITWGPAEIFPALSFVYDEGPKDMPLWNSLPNLFRILGINDNLHRTPADLRLAAQEAGMWQAILDTTAVLNFEHMPFQAMQEFAKLKEAIEKFAADAEADDEILLEHLEECFEGREIPLDFGSKEHIQRFLDELPTEEAFTCATEKVKWTRWGSHHWSLKKYLAIKGLKKFGLALQRFYSTGKLRKPAQTALVDDAAPLSVAKSKAAPGPAKAKAKSLSPSPAKASSGVALSASSASSSSATSAPPPAALAVAPLAEAPPAAPVKKYSKPVGG